MKLRWKKSTPSSTRPETPSSVRRPGRDHPPGAGGHHQGRRRGGRPQRRGAERVGQDPGPQQLRRQPVPGDGVGVGDKAERVGDGVGKEVARVPEQERHRRQHRRGDGGGGGPPGAAGVEAAAPDLGRQPDDEQHHHGREQRLDRQGGPEGEPGQHHPPAGQRDRGHGHAGHQQDVVDALPQVGEQQRVEADGQGHPQVPALAQTPAAQPQPQGAVDQQVQHPRVGIATRRPQRRLDGGQQAERPRPVQVVVEQRVVGRPPLHVDAPSRPAPGRTTPGRGRGPRAGPGPPHRWPARRRRGPGARCRVRSPPCTWPPGPPRAAPASGRSRPAAAPAWPASGPAPARGPRPPRPAAPPARPAARSAAPRPARSCTP